MLGQSVDRLFFAAFPDRPAAERISQLAFELRAHHRVRGMPLQTDRFHVSLCLVGNYYGLPSGLVAKAREAAAAISVRPFKVMFDKVMSFSGRPGNRPLVLCGGEGTPGLELLQDAVQTAMAGAGFRDSTSPHFRPHVTLLYGDHDFPEQPIEPISWLVRELVLVHSLHGRTMYHPKGRWLLRDGTPVELVHDPASDIEKRRGQEDRNRKPTTNDD